MNTLLESLVTGEFRFGFELEAYAKGLEDNYALEDYFDYDDYTDKYSPNEKFKQVLIKYFSQWFGNKLKIQMDESLKSAVSGFEFATPKMALTPLNIKKCIECLNDLATSEFNIITDDTCGFHIHFSFPNITTEDMAWIVCHIAYNESLQKLLKYFTTKNGESFNFFNKKYANDKFFNSIKKCIDSHKWKKLNELLSNDKYRLIRIHPQDNLEWRGPRNFMNKPDLKTIKEFFIQFYTIISEIIKIMDKKDINDISRKNFFKFVNLENILSMDIMNKKGESYNKLIDDFIKNPLKLTKLPSEIKIDIEHLVYELVRNPKFDLNIIRYQTFKNLKILKYLIEFKPEFINYVNNDLKTFLDTRNAYQTIKKNHFINPNIMVELLSLWADNDDLFNSIYNLIYDNNKIELFLSSTVKNYLLKRFHNNANKINTINYILSKKEV